MDLKKHLIELSETPGISGYEHTIRARVEESWRGLVDEMWTDALGSLIAIKYGSGPEPAKRLLVTAHMDEIGLMVTDIEDTFLRVINVGGIDRRSILSKPVIVHGEKDLPGLVGSRPPHVLSAADRTKVPTYDDIVIDTGQTASQLRKLVQIGAPVTIDQKCAELSNDLITGKAMDNRASLAVLTDLLHSLQNRSHAWDIVFAATVQEEVGRVGAYTMTHDVNPDLAIVIDTTWAIGTGVTDDKGFKLGDGPTLILGPNAHPKLFDQIMDTAKDLEVKLHPEPTTRDSGTDGFAVQISRDGVPTAIFGIPIRNMHTPTEVVSLKDMSRVTRIVEGFIDKLDETTLDKLSLDAE